MDPVTHLPTELAMSIFSNIQAHELFTLRRVSKSWNRLLKSKFLLAQVHKAEPFASTAGSLEGRLKRKWRARDGRPAYVLKVNLNKYGSTANPEIIHGGRYIAVTWVNDSLSVPAIELYDLGTGEQVAAIKLDQLLSRPVSSDEAASFSISCRVEADSKTALCGLVNEEDDMADAIVCAIHCETGDVMGRVVVPTSEEGSSVDCGLNHATNGKQLLSVVDNENGFQTCYVHDIRTGREIYRETLVNTDCTELYMDSYGTCYLLVERLHDDGVYTFNPVVEQPCRPRFVSLSSLFSVSTANFRRESITLRQNRLYARAFYTPSLPSNNDSCTVWYDLLTSIPCEKFAPPSPTKSQVGFAPFAKPTVLNMQYCNYQRLFWESSRLSEWGFSIPAYHSQGEHFKVLDTESELDFEVPGEFAGKLDKGLARPINARSIYGLGTHKKCDVTSHDDGIWVFRPRTEDYPPCYVLCFDEAYKVPTGLGKTIELEEYAAVVSQGVYRRRTRSDGDGDEDEAEEYIEDEEADNVYY